MKKSFFLICLFLALPLEAKAPWRERILFEETTVDWKRPWPFLGLGIEGPLQVLRSSPTGEKIYQKTLRKLLLLKRPFSSLVEGGSISRMDTTLVRRFSPHDPFKVEYQLKSSITINRGLNVQDAVLDLAHELTHFNEREGFNPYQGAFHWEDFVRSHVEGQGGEAEAYVAECQVMKEIFPQRLARDSKCLNIMGPKGRFSKALASREFYRVGKYYHHFYKRLEEFHLAKDHNLPLSKKGELFLSSAHGLPYPVAAIEEYTAIMAQACANDQRRFRRPASRAQQKRAEIRNFWQRCQNFLP